MPTLGLATVTVKQALYSWAVYLPPGGLPVPPENTRVLHGPECCLPHSSYNPYLPLLPSRPEPILLLPRCLLTGDAFLEHSISWEGGDSTFFFS